MTERERNTMRERHPWVASVMPPAGNLVSNPGMCPDWESNPGPFRLQVLNPLRNTGQSFLWFFTSELFVLNENTFFHLELVFLIMVLKILYVVAWSEVVTKKKQILLE